MWDDAGSLRTIFQYNPGCPERKGQGQRVGPVFPRSAESCRFAIVESSFLQSLMSLPAPRSPTTSSQSFKTVTKAQDNMGMCFLLYLLALYLFVFISLSFPLLSMWPSLTAASKKVFSPS